MSKQFSLSKILVVLFLRSGELSNDLILVFFGYVFDRSCSFNYGHLLGGGGASRGVGGERRNVREGGAGCGHVSFLSASKTSSFLEVFHPFFRSELLSSFIGVNIHGIGVSGGSVPGGGGGVECNQGSG